MATPSPHAACDLPGLTIDEVARRRQRGQVNEQPTRTSRTVAEIVRANVLTRFNLIITVLAAVVIAAGEPADALFAGVMVANTFVGIVQEVRAKRTLDRVRLLVAPVVTVRRDGHVQPVAPESIVLDDVIELAVGDQVAVDAEVVSSAGLELDESALTGESEPVAKQRGDEVLSGSVVVAGAGVAVARRVGADAWIHRLVVEAREFKLASSELRAGVDQILRVVGWMLVPLSGLLLWSQLRANDSLEEGLIATVAGVVGLVPQGLVLLVSAALAVAVVRLAREHVVVQELHAVEGLARVDVLCVDKTGTLTTGEMQVVSLDVLTPSTTETVGAVLKTLAASEVRPTTTLQVVAQHVGGATVLPATRHVSFSSDRKWSAVELATPDGPDRTWVLGAPEILAERLRPGTDALVETSIRRSVDQARRVVLLATSEAPLSGDLLPGSLEPRAVVALAEEIRDDAGSTMAYFDEQGVQVKVISGDHPSTVAAVAASIGIVGAERAVDMRQVDTTDTTTLAALVEDTVVFGRVLPAQKRDIVGALQRAGHHVAMTGDGVNDIPALKAADIGVAMDTASPATKAVSQLVLLDGRFDRMPSVVAEGRRVVANMERVSALFVTKTVYAALFALTIGAWGAVFPFLPRQMSLVSEVTIGVPAFALSFRAAHARCTPGYLRRVMRFALPAGLTAAAATLCTYWLTRSPLGGASLDAARSASTMTLIGFAWWILIRLMRPIDRWDAALLGALFGVVGVTFAIDPIRRFYRLDWPPSEALIVTATILAGTIVIAETVLGSRRQLRSRVRDRDGAPHRDRTVATTGRSALFRLGRHRDDETPSEREEPTCPSREGS